jgi:uncharacterized protein (TIGR03084 family)
VSSVAARADVLSGVLADLASEGAWLDGVLAGLDESGWQRPTPAPGWTISHQVAHLAWTDEQALCAATDPQTFTARLQLLLTGEVTVDSAAAEGAALSPPDLLQRYRAGRAELAAVLVALPDGTRLPWFGTEMSAPSMATARLMESWAHGNDVAEALGVPHPATNGLRHIAYLGVRTRDFAFMLHGLTPPQDAFLIRLTAPDGTTWSWGPDDAAQRVEGSALDFCLLAAQRRNRLDTDLVGTGPDADRWLDIAQAFAGPPGEGRAPAGPASTTGPTAPAGPAAPEDKA